MKLNICLIGGLLYIDGVTSIQLDGIDKDDLLQEQIPHW